MRRTLVVCLALSVVRCACLQLPAAEDATPSGNAEISAAAGPSEIRIRTTSRLAGAIDSLTWNGQEFIDSTDHGRQLQSAANFDLARPFVPEIFNPTEAGSRADGAGQKSSSLLLNSSAQGNQLETTTQMAFWLAPGERSDGHLALNDRILSDHRLHKQVRIGWQDLPHVLDYTVTFTIPAGEIHHLAQFETLTGYMPARFEKFWGLDLTTGRWQPLDDGPGEQPLPVALATSDGRFAMGVIAPGRPPAGAEGPGYGRFRFAAEKVVKWNCVFRVRHKTQVPAGDYRFQQFVAVGTLEDVRRALCAVAARTVRD